MQPDVAELRDFYKTLLGRVMRRAVSNQIRALWPVARERTIVGLGFASPYLGAYRGGADRLILLMPASQGALVWPPGCRTHVTLVEEDALPLPDNSIDLLLLVHGLEVVDRPAPMLREIWRVLVPEGRLLLVVPNRRGVWARLDSTPLGHGRPYSRSQLEALLRQALFTPSRWSTALHFPPFLPRFLLRAATKWEKIGARLWPAFCGVIIVEARKEIIAPLGKRAAARVLREFVGARRDHVPQ